MARQETEKEIRQAHGKGKAKKREHSPPTHIDPRDAAALAGDFSRVQEILTLLQRALWMQESSQACAEPRKIRLPITKLGSLYGEQRQAS